MRWIYLIILSSFSMLTFGQDMKIGFLDSNTVVSELKEIYYLDSLQQVILKQNSRLSKIAVRYCQEEYKKAINYYSKICDWPSSQAKSIEEKFLQYEKYIMNLEKEINYQDSLLRLDIADYIKKELAETVGQFSLKHNFDLILEKETAHYIKPNLDITKEIVDIIKKREMNEWKNDEFIQLVNDWKEKYNLPAKKITEFMKFKYSVIH